MKTKKAKCTIQRPESYKDGKWTYHNDEFEVIVLATCGKWVMARRPYCVPFVCETKEIEYIK